MINKTLFFTLTYDRLNYLKLMIGSLEKTVSDYNNITHLFIIQGCKETKKYFSRLLLPGAEGNQKWIINDYNMGIAHGWNQAMNFGLENNYNFICKIDDDAVFKTEGWLDAAKKIINHFNGLAVVSPAVKGLTGFPNGVPRYAKTKIKKINIGFVPHLGGITQITTLKVYKLFGKFREDVPLHSSQDSRFSSKLFHLHRVKFIYLEDYFVNHGPVNTKQQEEDYKEYFKRRKIERVKTLKEIQQEQKE